MSASELSTPSSYNQEQLQQILQLAITRQADREEFSREELWEIATELEIPLECMQKAEQDWLSQQLIDQRRQTFNLYRKEKLQQKVAKYAIINVFLVSLNSISSSHLSWSVYTLLISGMFLSLSAWRTYQSKGEAYEQDFLKWERKRQLKQSVQTLWQMLQRAWQS